MVLTNSLAELQPNIDKTPIYTDGKVLEILNVLKYFGATIDNILKFDDYVSFVIKIRD
jgi:hypothetical protein